MGNRADGDGRHVCHLPVLKSVHAMEDVVTRQEEDTPQATGAAAEDVMDEEDGSTSSGSGMSGSDTEGESDDDPIDLSSNPDAPATAAAAAIAAAPPPKKAPQQPPPPCPDCMRPPAPGDTTCICGLPLRLPAAAPPQPKPAPPPPKKKASKAQKVQRWYVEVGKRLTGVPSFVIKDAQLIYRKALKETSRQGCTEQGERASARLHSEVAGSRPT